MKTKCQEKEKPRKVMWEPTGRREPSVLWGLSEPGTSGQQALWGQQRRPKLCNLAAEQTLSLGGTLKTWVMLFQHIHGGLSPGGHGLFTQRQKTLPPQPEPAEGGRLYPVETEASQMVSHPSRWHTQVVAFKVTAPLTIPGSLCRVSLS